MNELLLALALMCQNNMTANAKPYSQRKCVAEILLCLESNKLGLSDFKYLTLAKCLGGSK